jgi:type 1 glutamine amidotransferase
MNGIAIFIRRIVLITFTIAIICSCANRKNDGLIKVLILSGRNNHEWQKTTPLLLKIYNDSRLFTTTVTEKPDTLAYKDLKTYDVIVSNWNTWPDNETRMDEEREKDFLKYVKEGGGVVFIHAGGSSFYSWNEYHQIGIGRWGKETHHGKPVKGKVSGFDPDHPVTQGLRDFYITDEIWEKTDIFPGAIPLASVTATDETDSHQITEHALFVNSFGKGRSFFTTLGHDERALLNTGLQTILLRATQWAAHRNVTIEAPPSLRKKMNPESNSLNWEQTDTTLILKNYSDKIWQYNFNNRYGKTYFHPVTLNNSTISCASPPDHPWHLGLWFSWKFINGVNYWEYLNEFKSEETGYRSAGITGLQNIEITRNPDFSALIRMNLEYHPAGGDTIMTEKRTVYVSAPGIDGSYFIDHENIFSTLIDEVILDRTPIEGEPEGQSWGGYAGLSIRFNQDYSSPEVIVPTESINYRKNNWLYMGFNTLTGEKAGISVLQNLKYSTSTTSWYVINNPETPFYYYSPAVLFDGKIRLKKGETLQLKYRVWIIPGNTGKKELQKKYDEYINS